MGDMADYYNAYDMSDYTPENKLSLLLEKSDKKLVKKSKKATEGIIQGIRNYYKRKKKLTINQRVLLAKWILLKK